MDRREQLRLLADRFLEFANKPHPDPEKLSAFLAKDLITRLTYPGEPSGYTGLKNLIAKLHGALHSYSLTLVTPIIDEVDSKVVYFVKSTGIQNGYGQFLRGVNQ
jgi:hypothetical protein